VTLSSLTASGFRVVSPDRLPSTLFAGCPRPGARPAPVLPMTRAEMQALGWDSCDVVLVTGDAYVDHPSFGAALVGRLLEAHGYRVGIIAQPDWRSAAAFGALGRPNLMFGITAGNMDSMVNRYTSDRRIRSDDAYSPDGKAGLRPDRSVIVYAQRCREACKDVPVVIGGIEASLRRIAHFDYWSEKVRRSVVLDAKADLLVYGNGERQIVEIARRLAAGEPAEAITDVRGTAFARRSGPPPEGLVEIDSREVDSPAPGLVPLRLGKPRLDRGRTVLRLPDFEQVEPDAVLYAHASRVLHSSPTPGNARALVQRHGDRDVWINPPPLPLATPEMDAVYELPYSRRPHPAYGAARIPAYEMIKTSVTITRGCFGGCTFCSITEHEGRIIQNRSEPSVLREIERVGRLTPGFTGVISDLGGPTANMYRLACKSPRWRPPAASPPASIRRSAPTSTPTTTRWCRCTARRAPCRGEEGAVASGVRYDLAATSPSTCASWPAITWAATSRSRPSTPRTDRCRRCSSRVSAPTSASRSCSTGTLSRRARSSTSSPTSSPRTRAPPTGTWSSWRCGSRRMVFAPIKSRHSCPRPWPPRPRCTTRG
jgi:uncharacterized radical SAM protein YgiQ